ncbi:MAG: phosphoenolpyruvate synthase [Pseudomonadales bacterium]|nr:phosphoenolpyruvate synthase [Pseudomonadales bacterium]
MIKSLYLWIVCCIGSVFLQPSYAEPSSLNANIDSYQAWVSKMKDAPKGPFYRIRWFCNDGSVLPPKAYACVDHGGGVQHGQYSQNTETIRSDGFYIANLLAGKDLSQWIDSALFTQQLDHLLIEKYLIAADDGWIFRQAAAYRGAYQEEDERLQARQLLQLLIQRPSYLGPHFAELRTAVKLLPHGLDTSSASSVRQMATSLSNANAKFMPLRAKIHNMPSADDASAVRAFAANADYLSDRSEYDRLADAIDQLYQAKPLILELQTMADSVDQYPQLAKLFADAAVQLKAADASTLYQVSADLLAVTRKNLAQINQPQLRLQLLDFSLRLEAEHFKASTQLRAKLSSYTRSEHVSFLIHALNASYGAGLINTRSYQAALNATSTLLDSDISIDDYNQQLAYLGRVPSWGTQTLRFEFQESMQKLMQIEPLAGLFIQDQLRGSPLLFFSQTLDRLSRDANRLSGIKHKLFEKEIGSGFHALNPGLARGRLHIKLNMDNLEDIEADGIYVLPETVSDLPPLAGIITAGEGNPLSHVQLLARNLGIPNVSIQTDLIESLAKYDGKMVVMAVSASGLVEFHQDSAVWQNYFAGPATAQAVKIKPDLKKLDLDETRFLNLNNLRASDSGRTVGPKAAKLGELHHHYPNQVASGVVIPFGLFKATVLDQPYKGSEKSVFDWMVEQYDVIKSLSNNTALQKQTAENFRAELYQIILNAEISAEFSQALSQAMLEVFGTTEIGVFVRSDTNVEDLPGFTGAGLNLTLPNVIGIDGVLDAINRVWASPFTARAFAWRQSHMDKPQHVYPAVLLLQSVANDKSGVLVTQDIDTGNNQVISVAVNEGVGGAVDGQSAESLRVDMNTGEVKLLATASAPWRRQPAPSGGIEKLPASGSDSVLQPSEVQQLIKFAKALPTTFPAITDDKGNPAPADVEFGFINGDMRLFQLRPFLQNAQTQSNQYLIDMDNALSGAADKTVDMGEVLSL